MMLCNIPAGYYRTSFGFFNMADFDLDLWKKVRNEAKDKIELSKGITIHGSDLAMKSIRISQKNLGNVPDLKRIVRFKGEDALEISAPKKTGTLIVNPPYGERIYKDEVAILYQRLGEHLEEEFSGYTLGILSSNKEALDLIHLNKIRTVDLMNGSIECDYRIYKV